MLKGSIGNVDRNNNPPHFTKNSVHVVGVMLHSVAGISLSPTIFVSLLQRFPQLLRPKQMPKDLLIAEGEEWRRARRILSPTFSASKMKMVSPAE